MKNLKILFLFCSLSLLRQVSHAQVVDPIKRFEISGGMVMTQGQKKFRAATGFWLTPHLSTQLFVLSGQGKIPCLEPENLMITNGFLENHEMRMGYTFGLNFRLYQKPKNGLFAGLGVTRQKYVVVATTEYNIKYHLILLEIVIHWDLVLKPR